MRKSPTVIQILLTGLLGGALCGFLIALPRFYNVPHVGVVETAGEWLLSSIEISAMAGIQLGGLFGIIAFPVCYYIFLRTLPLKLSLPVTIAATVLSGWLSLLFPNNKMPYFISGILSVFTDFYGAGFAGLLASSLVLFYSAAYRRRRRNVPN